MELLVAGKSHVGGVRNRNEDEWLSVQPGGGTGPFSAATGLVAAVIDGMGGLAGGDVAARIAREEISSAVTLTARLETPASELRSWAHLAHEAIAERARTEPSLRNMGAVLTAALFIDTDLHLLQIGDTRLYRLRRARMQQLSRDQTAVARLVASGQLSAQDARRHPLRNQVDGALGVRGPLRPVLSAHPVEDGDRYLLCSDGLTEMVADPAIAAVLQRHGDPAGAVEALVQAALGAGGYDNVTAVVVHCRGKIG